MIDSALSARNSDGIGKFFEMLSKFVFVRLDRFYIFSSAFPVELKLMQFYGGRYKIIFNKWPFDTFRQKLLELKVPVERGWQGPQGHLSKGVQSLSLESIPVLPLHAVHCVV